MSRWPGDRLLYGGDVNPEQWSPQTLDEDIEASVLICTENADHRYPVEDGIPNMLPPAD